MFQNHYHTRKYNLCQIANLIFTHELLLKRTQTELEQCVCQFK